MLRTTLITMCLALAMTTYAQEGNEAKEATPSEKTKESKSDKKSKDKATTSVTKGDRNVALEAALKAGFNYSEVVETKGATKDQLFKTSRAWFLENYGIKKQEAGVIYTDDSYLGEIAASPIMWVVVHALGHNTNAGSVSYNIVVSSKEGKYKYELSEFYHESNRSPYGTGGALTDTIADCAEAEMSPVIWDEIRIDGHSKAEKLILSLKERMGKAAEHVEGEDW